LVDSVQFGPDGLAGPAGAAFEKEQQAAAWKAAPSIGGAQIRCLAMIRPPRYSSASKDRLPDSLPGHSSTGCEATRVYLARRGARSLRRTMLLKIQLFAESKHARSCWWRPSSKLFAHRYDPERRQSRPVHPGPRSLATDNRDHGVCAGELN